MKQGGSVVPRPKSLYPSFCFPMFSRAPGLTGVLDASSLPQGELQPQVIVGSCCVKLHRAIAP